MALLPRYKERMLEFTPTREWEESMIIYFIINGLRIKNSQFNDKLEKLLAESAKGEKSPLHVRPKLRLVPGTAGGNEERTAHEPD